METGITKATTLPSVERKALATLLTSPKEYYRDLVVSSVKDAVNSPELPLSAIRSEIGMQGVRAVLVIALSELVQFFNVGKTMNDVQVAMTADLIISRYYYLKLEELKYCFQQAMCYGKVFDRLDGNVILGWIRDYDMMRDECVTDASISEANEKKRQSETSGMFYNDYIAYLQKLADEGDDIAKHKLEINASVREQMKKRDKEAEFKRWKEEYYRRKQA